MNPTHINPHSTKTEYKHENDSQQDTDSQYDTDSKQDINSQLNTKTQPNNSGQHAKYISTKHPDLNNPE